MEYRSEGNLIHALNHSNPSQMLMDALSTDHLIDQKEEDFFLGHLSYGPSDGLKVSLQGISLEDFLTELYKGTAANQEGI